MRYSGAFWLTVKDKRREVTKDERGGRAACGGGKATREDAERAAFGNRLAPLRYPQWKVTVTHPFGNRWCNLAGFVVRNMYIRKELPQVL